MSDVQEDQAGGAAEVDEEPIRRRAYELHESGEGGTAEENWHRAEAELRGAAGAPSAES